MEFRFKDKGFTFLGLNPGWASTDLAGEGMAAYVSLTFFKTSKIIKGIHV
jgi:hypothetical protein